MSTLLRRARGTVGIGLSWSIVWALVGALTAATAVYLLLPLPSTWWRLGLAVRAAAYMAVGWGILGFATGSLFSLALTVTERRRGLHDLSIRRFAAWGAGAGLVPPVALFAVQPLVGSLAFPVFLFGISIGLGAACAAATLAIARSTGEDEGSEPSAVRA